MNRNLALLPFAALAALMADRDDAPANRSITQAPVSAQVVQMAISQAPDSQRPDGQDAVNGVSLLILEEVWNLRTRRNPSASPAHMA